MAELNNTKGITYTENTTQTKIKETSYQSEGESPVRILGLSTTGVPYYIPNDGVLRKNDVTITDPGTDGVQLQFNNSSELARVRTGNENGISVLKVKMPNESTTNIFAGTNTVGNNAATNNNVRIKVSDSNNSTSERSVVIKGTGATTVECNGSGVITVNSSPQVQSNWNETDSSKLDFIKNKPSIPSAQVNSDWNSNSGVSQILNKPQLKSVATTGNYNDLINKPSIPAADDHKVQLNSLSSNTQYHLTGVEEATTITGNKTLNVNTNKYIYMKNNDLYASAFYANSDRSLKKDIVDISDDAIDKINEVQIKEFNWKSNGKHSVGVIAQDVKESGLDFLVQGTDKLSVDYTSILLLKIAALEKRIKELESK